MHSFTLLMNRPYKDGTENKSSKHFRSIQPHATLKANVSHLANLFMYSFIRALLNYTAYLVGVHSSVLYIQSLSSVRWCNRSSVTHTHTPDQFKSRAKNINNQNPSVCQLPLCRILSFFWWMLSTFDSIHLTFLRTLTYRKTFRLNSSYDKPLVWSMVTLGWHTEYGERKNTCYLFARRKICSMWNMWIVWPLDSISILISRILCFHLLHHHLLLTLCPPISLQSHFFSALSFWI